MSQYENKPMTGALFKREKRSDRAPDYAGPFYGPDGEELEVSAWLKKSKKGETYMSVSVKEKWKPTQRQEPAPQAAPPAEELDDDLPF